MRSLSCLARENDRARRARRPRRHRRSSPGESALRRRDASSSISGRGKKHGVSESGNSMLPCVRRSRCAMSSWYCASVQLALKRSRSEAIIDRRSVAVSEWPVSDAITRDQKPPVSHDLLVVHPDVEVRADDVDVRRRIPVGAGVRAVGVAEGDVDAGELLVLQDVADDVASARCWCRSRTRRRGRSSRRCACSPRTRRAAPGCSECASTSRFSSTRTVSGVSSRLPYRSHR